jgi:hypothetical protein
VATTSLHPEPAHPDIRVELLKIDPRVVALQGATDVSAAAPAVVVFSSIARAKTAHPTLWLANGAFFIATAPPEGASELFAGLTQAEALLLPTANAAIGIADDDGMLIYAETTPLPDAPQVLDRLLARLGCSSRMTLAHALTPALGGTTSISGSPIAPTDVATVRLVRREGPSAHSIFEETPVVAPEVWQPLQMRRVRYFKKPTPAASSSAPLPQIKPPTN